ncbi:MAG TPA: response regulator [Verrucomicrobiales bacterium]|nr:response regulator [Verrucomicrobiales bacterium]HIL72047.1 response regulator [Verrucomicrobiota bacterium]
MSISVELESQTDEDALLRFAVRDTGLGIPHDKQGALFDQFTQADSSQPRKFGGPGIGLAISKQLAEMMGGEIGVNSEPGRGSEFWITARFKKQPESKGYQKPVCSGLKGIKILIVDDNATNRALLGRQLISWGAQPDEVPDGATGLCRLREAVQAGDPYRLAILDMEMPDMGGVELGKTIKGDVSIADIALVLLTAVKGCDDMGSFEEIGFSNYIAKPVHQSDLFDKVVTAVNGKGGKIGKRVVKQSSIPESQGHDARILLVEDNAVNQTVALAMLKIRGLTADTAINGVEALKAMEFVPYNLVFMDCQMPEMDGYEATRQIRSSLSKVMNHDVPIIAMTANAMIGDREKCLNSGMSDYISKPINPASLTEALEKWLPYQKESEPTADNQEQSSFVAVESDEFSCL